MIFIGYTSSAFYFNAFKVSFDPLILFTLSSYLGYTYNWSRPCDCII